MENYGCSGVAAADLGHRGPTWTYSGQLRSEEEKWGPQEKNHENKQSEISPLVLAISCLSGLSCLHLRFFLKSMQEDAAFHYHRTHSLIGQLLNSPAANVRHNNTLKTPITNKLPHWCSLKLNYVCFSFHTKKQQRCKRNMQTALIWLITGSDTYLGEDSNDLYIKVHSNLLKKNKRTGGFFAMLHPKGNV